MSDGPALLASVLAAPDDDAPRLVYADWLDEHGEAERAEFVRASIVVGRHTDCPRRIEDESRGRPIPLRCGLCDYCKARRRCDELSASIHFCPALPAYSYLHDAPTPYDPPRIPGPGFHLTVRRGFVGAVECSADLWLAHGDAILAAHPVVEVWLATWPHWSTLTRHDHAHLGDTYLEDCRRRWPSVKTWHLPETR